jgi:hypothetical protein
LKDSSVFIFRARQSGAIGLLDTEDEGITVFQSIGNYIPTTQHHIPEDLNLQLV